jgi:2-C-methyl-D-erythritol 4-phosphate cytidylyltransferase
MSRCTTRRDRSSRPRKSAVFEAAKLHGGASLAAPVPDTLKRADDRRFRL